jgi:hypothetical protein
LTRRVLRAACNRRDYIGIGSVGLFGGTMKVDGHCHCGQIRYEAEIDADKVNICHCTDCQTLAGTSYRVGTLTQRAALPPKRQIWFHSALPWISDIRSLEHSPRG